MALAGPDIRAEIRAAASSFRVNEAQLTRLLTSGPESPVFRQLARRAIRVTNAAKLHATDRPGPRVRTGRLRGSITWRLGRDSLSPYADVGSAVHYAVYVELGHRVVRRGAVVGHAPAYPYLRPALLSA
jgi:Bacteriophage HK97-gp10, putative tail-component